MDGPTRDDLDDDQREIFDALANFLERRGLLAKAGAAAGVGIGLGFAGTQATTQNASADPQGRVGSQADPVSQAYVDQLGDATTPVTNGEFQTVSTEDLSVTAETVAIPTRSTTSSSTSAGSRIAAYDGDSKDNLSEFSSGTFSPTETGGYNVTAIVEFAGASASGDTVECIVTSSASDASLPIEKTLPRGGGKVDFSFPTKTFDSANDYTIEARNIDSNFKIDKGSRASIVREVLD